MVPRQNISKERKKELPLLMALGDGTRPETASPADGKAVSGCGLFVSVIFFLGSRRYGPSG